MIKGLSCALVLFSVALGTLAAPRHEDEIGEHVVSAGETLTSVTRKYLGDSSFWRENWRLNADIADPDRLVPGQKIQVIVSREVIAEEAQVSEVANQVDKNLAANWVPATAGDQLRARNGLRTLQNSSAVLDLNESTRLRLSEFTQIFLESRTVDLRGRESGTLEVIRGSADIELEPLPERERPKIEILAGNATITPNHSATATAIRAHRATPESDASMVMVYSGRGNVSASGNTVDVPRGMGTVVPERGPPGQPEQLLSAPTGLLPLAGEQWRYANRRLSWQPQTDSVGYMVEICRDPRCGQLMAKQQVTEVEWQPVLEKPGIYYWRVSAISASGLTGFSSDPVPFELLSTAVDQAPPVVAIVPVGHFKPNGRQKWLVGLATRLTVLAHDDASGVDRIEWQDGVGAWQVVPEDGVAISAIQSGEFRARAMDNLGKVSATVSVALDTH